ncbi:MAG: hypothetical protein K9K93_00860 [Acholeplasmataceae bacterium]|nr:hypothetical protein [Acholeplasmataceae bacterium]
MSGFFLSGIANMILAVLIVLGIILLIREIVMWYWKINQIVENQEEEIRLLKKLVEKISSRDN